MARVTVEDCLEHVENRFELVEKASKRARKLIREGIDPLVPWENDKATVVALREIAAGKLKNTNKKDVKDADVKEEEKSSETDAA